MSPLSSVHTLHVERGVVDATLEALREYGQAGYERMVVWLGNVDGDVATVTRVVVPPQEPIVSDEGVGYFVTGDTLFQVNQLLHRTGLRLISQVHSHPGAAYHSAADDRAAVVTEEGGFSLVVPDFGFGDAAATAWAAYRLRRGLWTELSRTAWATLLGASS